MSLTRSTVLAELAAAAQLPAVDPADDLFDLGIDSVRLMALVRGWRDEVPALAFEDAASAGSVAELLRVLNA